MTNRNQKIKDKKYAKVKEQIEQSKNEKKERKYEMLKIAIAVITIIISALSLGLSLVAISYADREYKYKLSPDIDAKTGISVKAYKVGDSTVHQIQSEGIEIQIVNKNNLKEGYLIYPSNIVKKLNINEIEGTLEENLNEGIKLGNYDLDRGDKFYQYRFLLLRGMDDSYDLYLIYTKTGGEEIVFNVVSGIEVWGLANSNKDNIEYDGEKIMASKYQKILEEISDYIK